MSKKILLINIYGHNQDKPDFFNNIIHEISKFTPDYVICGGDFNFPMDVSVDKKGSVHITHQRSRDIWTSYVENSNLKDIWRTFHPDKEGYTWRRMKPNRVCVHLDYFFVSDSLMQMIINSEIMPGFRTDHSIVVMKISIDFPKRGPGYWKFNTFLLRDRDYLLKINKLIDIELARQAKSYREKWQLLKLAIRGTTLQYASRKKKSNFRKLEVLERQIQKEFSRGETMPYFLIETHEHQISLLRKEIEQINAQLTKGAIMRSRADWQNLAEKPTKYFCALERKNFSAKTIYRLKLDSGEVTTDPKQILKEQERYYKQLYTSVGKIDTSYVEDIDCPKISEEENALLEAPLDRTEMAKALKLLANNKSPGTDGLPADFYKVYFGKIKDLLFNVYLEAIDTKQLHLSARRGIISLLEKLGKDNLILKS